LNGDFIEILEQLADNPLIAIGGFLTLRKPTALIKELSNSKVDGLVIISLSGSFEIDLLLESGKVNEIIAPYVGGDSIAPVTPVFRDTCMKGEIIAEPWDTAVLVKALQASIDDIPFIDSETLNGTDIPANNRRMTEYFATAYTNAFVRINAIKPNLAIIHASYADNAGNACFNGSEWGDILLANASEKVIVSVEEYKTEEDNSESDNIIPVEQIGLMIEIPNGAKPFSSPRYYDIDMKQLENSIIKM
jgi:glutaconate CoA-transferase subunit A